MSERAAAFTPVVASGVQPPEEPVVFAEGLVLGPWVVRRAQAAGPGGSLISRRGNLVSPTLVLARRRRAP